MEQTRWEGFKIQADLNLFETEPWGAALVCLPVYKLGLWDDGGQPLVTCSDVVNVQL